MVPGLQRETRAAQFEREIIVRERKQFLARFQQRRLFRALNKCRYRRADLFHTSRNFAARRSGPSAVAMAAIRNTVAAVTAMAIA